MNSSKMLTLAAALLMAACSTSTVTKNPDYHAGTDQTSDHSSQENNKDSSDNETTDNETGDDNGIDVVSDETCDDTWEEFCDENNAAHFCNENGKITTRDCSLLQPTGSVCKKMADANFVDCVFSCDIKNWSDYNSCQGVYVATHTCEKTTDGSYAEYSFTNNPCTFGCQDGTCLTAPLPTEGAYCNPATFSAECFGNDYYYCQDEAIVKVTCDTGLVCAKAFGDTLPQCTTTCSNYDNDSYSCNGQQLDNYVCRVSSDGKKYYFHETTTCQKSCNDGVCDATVPQANSSCDPDTMNDVCAHNTLYYCNTETSKVTAIQCGVDEAVGQQLCRYKDSSYADCVTPNCDPDDEESNIIECGSDKDENGNKFHYVYGYICEPGLDGSNYYFSFEEKCTGDCKNGKCL